MFWVRFAATLFVLFRVSHLSALYQNEHFEREGGDYWFEDDFNGEDKIEGKFGKIW
jgi:hypothetical protein